MTATQTTDTLMGHLEGWRQALGLNHNEFATDVLHIDQATWSLVRRKKRPANAKLIGRLVLQYPWLARYLDTRARTQETQGRQEVPHG